jgi:hypothetical protein
MIPQDCVRIQRFFNSANPNDSYDKDAFAAAKDGSGTAYATITNFIEVCGIPAFSFGQIEVWRTRDGGISWEGPTIAAPDLTFITDPSNPDCGLTDTLQQGSSPRKVKKLVVPAAPRTNLTPSAG